METHFNFKHIINIGICLSEENIPIDNIIKLIDKYNKSNHIVVCDIKNECNEFVTLDLIETHKSTFDDNDLIFYLHTKGASKQKSDDYKENVIWRNRMQDVNIKNHNHVFNLFNSTDFNTYGLLLENVNNLIYSGNFWWVKGKYIKTINIEDVEKNRWNAESQYIQNGTNWNPYSEYVKMIKTKPPYYKKNKLI
jgi:hypothetical protein